MEENDDKLNINENIPQVTIKTRITKRNNNNKLALLCSFMDIVISFNEGGGFNQSFNFLFLELQQHKA